MCYKDINKEQYETCKNDIENKIKEKKQYKFTNEDKCFGAISFGLFMDKYRHKYIIDQNEFIKGKLVEHKSQEYVKCKDKMKENIEQNGFARYYKDNECHNYLENLKSKKYQIETIKDKIIEYNGNNELIHYKYIGFIVKKK